MTVDNVELEQLMARAAAMGMALVPQTSPVQIQDYVATLAQTTPANQWKTYGPYLNRLATHEVLRELQPKDVTVSQLSEFVARSTETATIERGARRNTNGGLSAQENTITALRWFFKRAMGDNLTQHNPALQIAKPRRAKGTRHGLTADQLAELFAFTGSVGDDTELDALLVRFMVETGARRQGPISLRLKDLDPDRSTVKLREKNDPHGTEQPVSPTLLKALQVFAASRGSTSPTDPVFRYKRRGRQTIGRPLTRRRFNTLADRWQSGLEFGSRLGVSPHLLRHTAIGMVESVAGYAVARAFARHTSSREVTTTYLARDIHDVAHAIEQLTGEEHPLSRTRWQRVMTNEQG